MNNHTYESFVKDICMELFGFGKEIKKDKEVPVNKEKVLEYISSQKMAQLINDCEMKYLKYYDNSEYSNLFKMLYGKSKLSKSDLSYTIDIDTNYDSLQELKRMLQSNCVDPHSNEITITVSLSNAMNKKGHASIDRYCGKGNNQNLNNLLYNEFKRIDSIRDKQWIGIGAHLCNVPDESLYFYYNVITNQCEFEWDD